MAIARLIVVVLVIAVSLLAAKTEAAVSLPEPVKLQWHYYKVHNICRDAEEFIRHQVKVYWNEDRSIAPKLLRLLYSDCFVTVSLSIFLSCSMISKSYDPISSSNCKCRGVMHQYFWTGRIQKEQQHKIGDLEDLF